MSPQLPPPPPFGGDKSSRGLPTPQPPVTLPPVESTPVPPVTAPPATPTNTPTTPTQDEEEHSLEGFWSNVTIDQNAHQIKQKEEEKPRIALEKEAETGPVQNTFGTEGIHTESVDEYSQVTIDSFLMQMLDLEASDLHLTHGMPPMIRVHGDITPLEGRKPLTGENIRSLLFPIMSPTQQTEYQQKHDLDMSHEIPGRSRFRINVLQQRGHTGSVIRVIPNRIKSLTELGMPDFLADFADLPRGLVLVTGPTGSGKSTTLAAIIDAANTTRRDHILTIEEPIEFVHQNKNSIITQREIGVDTSSFPEALKRALREDPDIILVGEMRDPETISIAITAAETGHLVFGTLHTQSAAETMSRIIDSFPDGSKEQIRTQLAATIQGIVCQTLLKTIDGRGRVAAMEILKGTPNVKALIRKGGGEQIRSALETGKAKGMQTLDMSLEDLVKQDKVAVDEAAKKSTDPDDFYRQLGGEATVQKIRRRQAALGGRGIKG